MKYTEFPLDKFFKTVTTEKQARDLVWKTRFGETGFSCSKCGSDDFYELRVRPEVRECVACKYHVRLRAGTIFQDSRAPMLIWVRAIYLMMQGKRGISALELQRQLGVKRYEVTWGILYKVRSALCQRDDKYQIQGIIEFDGTGFGKRETGNQRVVLIGIETKSWFDEKGKARSKAGFAKILVGKEDRENAQKLVDKGIKSGSAIKTDGARVYLSGLKNIKTSSKNTYNDPKILDEWQPWVHKFISNAKSWVLGTHHGVSGDYLQLYLGEYAYRFNRRHDVKKLFHRALYACCIAAPVDLPASTG
jgi:Zn ribbon nucleic-acid-binding protein